MGLDAKTASYFFKNSMEISGEATGMTCTLPRRMQAISVLNSFIRRCSHLYLGLFLNNSGRFPTIGHGFGPGGSGATRLLFIKVLERKMKIKTVAGRSTNCKKVRNLEARSGDVAE